MMTITMLHVILMVGIVVVEQKISAKYVNVWKTMITMTTMTMMLILTMMIGGMKKLLPNLNNQRVKVKRVLKAKRALKTMNMSQNLQRVNHQRVHHQINPFSLATMITTINNLWDLQVGQVFKNP